MTRHNRIVELEPAITQWTVRLAEGRSFALFLFAPSRSVIKRATHVPPEGWDEPVPAESNYQGLAVTVNVPPALADQSPTVTIKTESLGEPLRLIAAESLREPLVPAEVNEIVLGVYEQIDRKRGALAQLEKSLGDPRHLFFHELDRQTDRDLIPIALPDRTEQQERISLVDQVGGQLRKCLFSRTGRGARTLPNADDLLKITVIFKSAALAAFGNHDPMPVATALLDFSAGWLGQTISVKPNNRLMPVTISEPDSTYVFLFAELAISAVAQGVEVAFWDPMIPSLVQMQRLYLERMHRSRPRMPFDSYGPPISWLSDDERTQLDRFYPTYDRADIDAKILENLNLTDLSQIP